MYLVGRWHGKILITSSITTRMHNCTCSQVIHTHEQVIYTHGAQANSAFHPFGVVNLLVVRISTCSVAVTSKVNMYFNAANSAVHTSVY